MRVVKTILIRENLENPNFSIIKSPFQIAEFEKVISWNKEEKAMILKLRATTRSVRKNWSDRQSGSSTFLFCFLFRCLFCFVLFFFCLAVASVDFLFLMQYFQIFCLWVLVEYSLNVSRELVESILFPLEIVNLSWNTVCMMNSDKNF